MYSYAICRSDEVYGRLSNGVQPDGVRLRLENTEGESAHKKH